MAFSNEAVLFSLRVETSQSVALLLRKDPIVRAIDNQDRALPIRRLLGDEAIVRVKIDTDLEAAEIVGAT